MNTQWIIGIIIIPLLELIRTYFNALFNRHSFMILQTFIQHLLGKASAPGGNITVWIIFAPSVAPRTLWQM